MSTIDETMSITDGGSDEGALMLATQLDTHSPLAIRERAILAAIQRYTIPIVGFIRSRVQDHHMREDLAQDVWEAFTQAVRQGRFQDRGIDPLHYLMGIARRRVAQYHTRDPLHCYLEVPLPEDDLLERIAIGDDIATTDLRLELDQYINAAWEQMLDEERVVARLWRQGYSPCEIAEYTHMQYRTAWRLTNRVVTLISRAAH
jgi:DNA-directed RNA polymerase specialized sigma24 family protein